MIPKLRKTKIWALGKEMALDPIRRAALRKRYPSSIPLQWCQGENWGDALSPLLVEALSGRSAVHVDGLHHDRYLAIGSILGGANERAEVWGSGYIRAGEKTAHPPRAIHAVRGPLTRKTLLDQGIDCPEVYGDPALLLPMFYNPCVEKKYALGLIPHYVDKEHPVVQKCRNDPHILVIDIEDALDRFVVGVKSCDVIVSSSLHGLICADAFGIPNVWIQLSNNVLGGMFKFQDYRASVGASRMAPVIAAESTRLANFESSAELAPMSIDLVRLLLSCPFLSSDLEREIRASLSATGGLPKQFTSSSMFG